MPSSIYKLLNIKSYNNQFVHTCVIGSLSEAIPDGVVNLLVQGIACPKKIGTMT